MSGMPAIERWVEAVGVLIAPAKVNIIACGNEVGQSTWRWPVRIIYICRSQSEIGCGHMEERQGNKFTCCKCVQQSSSRGANI